LPESCLEAVRTQEPRNLGEITYGDERIREGIYTVQVFPLSHDFLGVVFENVTDQRRSERALRESEERFRLLVQGVQEYGIFHLDPSGNVVSWNAGAARLMGYRAEEIVGKHISVFYPKDDVENGMTESNIAERRHAEEQFKETLDQLRALAARLQSVREEERASIAREIHDELGQACTAIKMDLALIGHKITRRQTQLRAKIESSMRLVDDM